MIFADAVYPVKKNHLPHAVIFCDPLTRFRDGSLIKDASRSTLVSSFLQNWISWIGPPKKLLAGSGSHFIGKQWSVSSNIYGFAVIVVPVRSHHAVGKVERLIQTFRHAYFPIDESAGEEAEPGPSWLYRLWLATSLPLLNHWFRRLSIWLAGRSLSRCFKNRPSLTPRRRIHMEAKSFFFGKERNQYRRRRTVS